MSASEFSGQVPGAAEADAHLIGLARLVMLMTATTIRDVLSFPFVKPQQP